MKKKKKAAGAEAQAPRRITVASTEAKFRNIADAFCAAQAAQAEAVMEVEGLIESYQTLLGNLKSLGKAKRKGGKAGSR